MKTLRTIDGREIKVKDVEDLSMGNLPLSLKSLDVLAVIQDRPGSSVADMATLLELSNSTIFTPLLQLTTAGLVTHHMESKVSLNRARRQLQTCYYPVPEKIRELKLDLREK